MTDIPDNVLAKALSVKTDDCTEGLQYALIRGLSAMGFENPSAETWELARAAGCVFVEWALEEAAKTARLQEITGYTEEFRKGWNCAVGEIEDAIRAR